MKRLLILSVSAGAGHNRAAEALAATGRSYPNVHVEWHDALRFTNKLFKKTYADSYLFMANTTPALWGFLYSLMGRNTEHKRLDQMVRAYDEMTYHRLMEHVKRFQPDAVLCTHFLPANVMIAHQGRVPRIPVYMVVTDFDVHSLWVNLKVTGYFVASDEVRWQLARFRYPMDRITTTGIPIHPAFQAGRERRNVLRELGLKMDLPIVLFMSGGFGIGQLEEAFRRIMTISHPFQILVIAGKNEVLRKKLTVAARPYRDRAHVFGFVNNIQDFMDAADLIITKAGGLTVSECLAKSLPMLIFSPIPGQEERNCDYLLECGAAVKAKSIDVLDFKVKELLEDPLRLDKMKSAALRIARPSAARDILDRVLSYASAPGR